jgi:hypothetical protein
MQALLVGPSAIARVGSRQCRTLQLGELAYDHQPLLTAKAAPAKAPIPWSAR